MRNETIQVQVEEAGRKLPEVYIADNGRYKGKPVVDASKRVLSEDDFPTMMDGGIEFPVPIADLVDRFNHGEDLRVRGKARAAVSAKVKPMSLAKVVDQVNNWLVNMVGEGYMNAVLFGQIKRAKDQQDEKWLRAFHQSFILDDEALPEDGEAWEPED